MATYFRRLIPGTAHSLYFIGTMADTGVFHVDKTQVSRPDGQEIHEPVRVTLLFKRQESTVRATRVMDAADHHKQNQKNLAHTLPPVKRCTKCELDRARGEYYIVTRDGQQRLHSWCKACVAERNARNAARRAA